MQEDEAGPPGWMESSLWNETDGDQRWAWFAWEDEDDQAGGVGPFPTRDEAVQAAQYMGYGDFSGRYFLGKKAQRKLKLEDWVPSAKDMIEWAEGQTSTHAIDDPDKDQTLFVVDGETRERLDQAVRGAVQAHTGGQAFWATKLEDLGTPERIGVEPVDPDAWRGGTPA